MAFRASISLQHQTFSIGLLSDFLLSMTVSNLSALYGAEAGSGIQLILDEELTNHLQHHPPKVNSKAGRKKKRRLPSKGDITRKIDK
ncbi:LOW QUALITY PROTEIN: putative phosphorylase b kinase regulatory subunit alpha-like isoform 1 [Phytophthora palmivora]|uniref:Phosphorylase b kinase regulatory subunit alpha-like isoform 1 n=1 Tax=Phytophthora palmivora TaxID=4796 RepID=A0A2P4YRZ2_9STRA|nr:LOW QUALITY PROTEIN: putative phosphorylase b kinase regulatory subunit alpha-like isoform 1 [Phytophthora palmivora]